MNNRRIMIILILGLLILAAGLVFLNFRIGFAQTSANTSFDAYSLGLDKVNQLPLQPDVLLHVEGNNWLSSALSRHLVSQIETSPDFDLDGVLSELQLTADEPLLFARVKQPRIFWTPIYAQSNWEVELYYASDGDLAWGFDEEDVVHLEESPSVRVHGTVTIEDHSYGLQSYRGYLSHLGKQSAGKLLAALQDSFYNVILGTRN